MNLHLRYGGLSMNPSTHQAATEVLYALPGHLLWRASARVHAELHRALPPGVDVHAYRVLLALGECEPRSQRSLARLTGTSGTTVAGVVRALQRDALVERVRNPEDRRSYALTRTPAGRRAAREWQPHLMVVEHRLVTAVGAGDAERLRALLRRVIGEALDPDTPRKLWNSTGFLVNRAHHQTRRDFLAALAPLGIEPREFGTLSALRVAGPATQGDLAQLLDVSPATVVEIVDDLEERGLLTRRRDSLDRRAYRLDLAGAADQVVTQAGVLATAHFDDRLDGPQGRGRADLVRLLRRLVSPGIGT